MLTFKQCKYFICIAEQGSFTAAADILCIAQSALSRQIKILEDEIGFSLFDRTEKRIQLTSAGSAFYQSLRHQLDDFQHSIERAKGVSRGENRTINIAHSSSIILDKVKLQIFEQLCHQYKIKIEIHHLSSEMQVEAILKSTIDIGFIRPPVYHSLDEVNAVTLYHAPLYVAVAASDQNFAGKCAVQIEDLKDVNFVSTPHSERGGLSYLAASLCLTHGVVQKKSDISSRKLFQLDLVAHGFGVCIVPEEFADIVPDNVKLLILDNKQHQSEVKLIWKKDSEAVINECCQMIQNLYMTADKK